MVDVQNSGDAEVLAVARLVGKLGFSIIRESVQYYGKSGVRPATDAEKKMWGALLEAELEYSTAEVAIMEAVVGSEYAKEQGGESPRP